MNFRPSNIQTIYVSLLALNTLAASLIWGINTLFLLDAGLSNTEAFAANAFFTAGMVLFEIPTGIIADSFGRRTSYLLGTLTLALSTIMYFWLWHIGAPFWEWAVASALLGLGFTFFSGAVEAWLVDALHATDFKGALESVFAKGQIATGIAMFVGSVGGGLIAQVTDLGVPYIIRAIILVVAFVSAFVLMKDIGFSPTRSKSVVSDVKVIWKASIKHGLHNPPVRWIMLAAPFTVGVSFYIFYAMQPYLLQLYGNSQAYIIAGLAAAVASLAQVAGGFLVPLVKRSFKRRTSILIINVVAGTVLLGLIGLTGSFWAAIGLFVIWGLLFAAGTPVRQAYLNGLIPSKQRATVLSFDSLMGSSGGVFIQPALGKAADVWSYGTSYLFAAGIQFIALPFMLLARREHAKSDDIDHEPSKTPSVQIG